MTDKTQARARLAELIERWLESGKNNTVQSLANESGVSYSTIRKILEGDTNPDTAREQALLLVVATDSEIEEYINSYQPTTKALLQRVRKNSDANSSLSQRFWDPNVYWITSQAYCGLCTRETVKEQLGEVGLNVLDSLVKEKSLVLADGKYRPNKDKPVLLYLTPEAVKHGIVHGVEASMKHDDAHRSVATFNVNEKTLADLKDSSREWFTNATLMAEANEGPYMISFAVYVTPVIKGDTK